MNKQDERYRFSNTLIRKIDKHKSFLKDYGIEVIIFLISILYLLLDIIFNSHPASAIIFRALTIALLFQICYKVIPLPSYIDLEDIFEAISKKKEMNILMTKHSEKNGCFKLLATGIYQKINTIISIEDNALIIKQQDIAIKSYLEFWKMLVEMQKSEQNKTYTVQCIHAFDMKMYDHKTSKHAERLLKLQKKFIDNKGKIFRILCSNSENLDEEIKMVAYSMEEIRIEVFYYNLGSNYSKDYAGDWDFAHVLETNDAYIWKGYNKHENNVTSAALTGNGKYDGKDLVMLWQDIKDNSNQIIKGELRGTYIDQ
jgi:hypothetical protein